MFNPPFCPWQGCQHNVAPGENFYARHGSYHPVCRPRPIPRFRCLGCGRTFSRQTFRQDYHDNRPHLNALVFRLVTSGVGIRQTARVTGLSRRCTELKIRKQAHHARALNLNVWRPTSSHIKYHFDEFETFEGKRNARPLTVPFLMESSSRYIVWAESATIRPRGRMTSKRLAEIAASEQRHGTIVDRSRAAIQKTLDAGVRGLCSKAQVTIRTDEKSLYPKLIRQAFTGHSVTHLRTNSRIERDIHNPLFPINHEEMRARDLLGRLRRRSWLASKRRQMLDLYLQLYATYRNLVCLRFNRDKETPAQVLGLVPRKLTAEQVLSWRQDWGRRSLHPLGGGRDSIQQFAA